MTVLHQDIGDSSGGLGGDTSALRLGRWLPTNPSIPVSVSRSRSGPRMRHAGRSRRSVPSTASRASRSTSSANARKTDGPAAVLEPRSRRPNSSPSRLSEEVKDQAVQVRAALEASGLDHGPISVHDKMHAMGLDPVPSIASLAPDLPRGRRRSTRAEEEATLSMAPVRLPGTERVLAARRHRVRPDRWPQVRDLPAHRRPLPLRGRLPCRLERDSRGSDHRLRQGRGRPRRTPTTALRQRARAQPIAARRPGPARRARDAHSAPSRSPASPTSRPPRARTNGSTRPCSATSTSSH